MESDLFKNCLNRSFLNNSLHVSLDAYLHMLTREIAFPMPQLQHI